ncbi:MAG: class I SAM-dependent methyltransferase [Rhodospirillales bacterium]|nr:class I SAM-dependent methyltransferase [Rhodospirillales bacterium]
MADDFVHELKLADFARLWGCSQADIFPEVRAIIEAHDFSYRILAGAERDLVLLDVIKRLDSGQLSLAGPEGLARWEKGWGENLSDFVASNDTRDLTPKYIRPGLPLRLDQQFIATNDPDFERNWYSAFRLWLFKTQLKDFASIFEFGCGSGFNLAQLSDLFPQTRITGLDWAQPSVDIANRLGEKLNRPIQGRRFDFFHSDASLDVPAGSAFLTVGALEQTGENFASFIDFVIAKRPKLCVFVEPISEWYDSDNIIDYTGIRFLTVRNYWRGFPTLLERLAKEGRVEILKTKRSQFGSLFIEGYSQVIWRPV